MPSAWSRYRLYGDPFRSSWPFQAPLPKTSERPHYTFELARSPFPAGDGDPLFISESLLEDGRPDLVIRGLEHGHVLTFPDKFEFLVTEGRVAARVLRPAMEDLLELAFLGIVSAFRLEVGGTLALHASAVAIGGVAVAFLGARRAGKTTVATHLSRGGAGLLTDDLLALRMAGEIGPLACPGYPQVRMWPEDAVRSGLDPESLGRVHPVDVKRRVDVESLETAAFVARPRPLVRIMVLDRVDEGEPSFVRRLHPRDALLELVRHSFLPRVMQAPTFRQARFRVLADLATRVPFRRLRYPAGRRGLEDVARMIEDDLGCRLGSTPLNGIPGGPGPA